MPPSVSYYNDPKIFSPLKKIFRKRAILDSKLGTRDGIVWLSYRLFSYRLFPRDCRSWNRGRRSSAQMSEGVSMPVEWTNAKQAMGEYRNCLLFAAMWISKAMYIWSWQIKGIGLCRLGWLDVYAWLIGKWGSEREGKYHICTVVCHLSKRSCGSEGRPYRQIRNPQLESNQGSATKQLYFAAIRRRTLDCLPALLLTSLIVCPPLWPPVCLPSSRHVQPSSQSHTAIWQDQTWPCSCGSKQTVKQIARQVKQSRICLLQTPNMIPNTGYGFAS